MSHAVELKAGERFAFGENWSEFLKVLNNERISVAKQSLLLRLGQASLTGRTFLDAGSGSGLFSLAARQLGAKVHSFDYDPQSVACTSELKRRYFPDDPDWVVEEGSVLDKVYLSKLSQFDIVYSWGVLHHTGNMAAALENVAGLVRSDGKLFIAIYNDIGPRKTKKWLWIKRTYCQLPRLLKMPFALTVAMPTLGYSLLAYAAQGKLRAFSDNILNYKAKRGMSWWSDQIDWIGGYPYESAKAEGIFNVFKTRGFNLEQLMTCGGGIGCNEYVFVKNRDAAKKE